MRTKKKTIKLTKGRLKKIHPTRKNMDYFGVRGNPKKGWKKTLQGTVIPTGDWEMLTRRTPVKKRKERRQEWSEKKEAYRQYLRSSQWKQIRVLVVERDKVCQICLKKYGPGFHVHHITYDHIFREREYLEDLQLLCEDCHNALHIVINGLKRFG